MRKNLFYVISQRHPIFRDDSLESRKRKCIHERRFAKRNTVAKSARKIKSAELPVQRRFAPRIAVCSSSHALWVCEQSATMHVHFGRIWDSARRGKREKNGKMQNARTQVSLFPSLSLFTCSLEEKRGDEDILAFLLHFALEFQFYLSLAGCFCVSALALNLSVSNYRKSFIIIKHLNKVEIGNKKSCFSGKVSDENYFPNYPGKCLVSRKKREIPFSAKWSCQ